MWRETRTVYSGKGTLINVQKLWNMQSRRRPGEHSQFHRAWEKNINRIRALNEMRDRTKVHEEELALRRKHNPIFEEYHKRECWQRVIESQRRSGLSVIAFCKERNVAVKLFLQWSMALERRK